MSYRELKEGEPMQEGDEYLSIGNWYKFDAYNFGCNFFEHAHYEKGRRLITKEEFDESCNDEPEFIIGKEPVDQVIYATSAKPIRNKYSREIAPGVYVDVYDVLKAFNVTNSALQHLIKKALAVGIRGHKDASEDYQDIIDSAIRAKELG